MAVASAVKRIFMCQPKSFRVEYYINPWMVKKNQVDKELAEQQWTKLKNTLVLAGAEVEVMDGEGTDQFPDIVFTANAAVVRGKRAYLANFFYPERKGERYFYKQWFESNGYETTGDQDIPFEGAGDALWAGKGDDLLICGVGPRTDVRALQRLAFELKDERTFKTIGCRLVDPRFYHIDTCFCPLGPELAIWYPYAFDPITQHNLSNEIELIAVPEKEAAQFACNSVVVGRNVIMPTGNNETAEMLHKRGFKVHFVEMSEFLKSGGAAKCCTLAI